MERLLNRQALAHATQAQGLSQATIARELGITRAAVSKWFNGQAFPRPAELLKLGRLLGLGFSELVEAIPVAPEPLVAFRKRAGTKTTPVHVERAREMGRLLEPVVRYLPFDEFLSPSRLKQPSLEPAYIQALVQEVRREIGADTVSPIDFEHLIERFNALQAVVVPVMWGRKQRHENALHIYLPESKTTWIFLNLDSHTHDFKFWMAHELGHVLAVDFLTRGDNDLAEDFSDAFAGALLFPEPAAEKAFADYIKAATESDRLTVLFAAAQRYVISPNTVYTQLRQYGTAHQLAFPEVSARALFAAITRFNQAIPCLSEQLFRGKKPTARQFVECCTKVFKTPVFAALAGYLKATAATPAVLSRMLDLPLTDAKELHAAVL